MLIYAESIRYVTIHEDRDFDAEDRRDTLAKAIERKRSARKRSKQPTRKLKSKTELVVKPITRYTILIHYVPSNRNLDSTDTCEVYTYEKAVAEKMFADIVHQYREQNPDVVYLDKIAEKFLGGIL